MPEFYAERFICPAVNEGNNCDYYVDNNDFTCAFLESEYSGTPSNHSCVPRTVQLGTLRTPPPHIHTRVRSLTFARHPSVDCSGCACNDAGNTNSNSRRLQLTHGTNGGLGQFKPKSMPPPESKRKPEWSKRALKANLDSPKARKPSRSGKPSNEAEAKATAKAKAGGKADFVEFGRAMQSSSRIMKTKVEAEGESKAKAKADSFKAKAEAKAKAKADSFKEFEKAMRSTSRSAGAAAAAGRTRRLDDTAGSGLCATESYYTPDVVVESQCSMSYVSQDSPFHAECPSASCQSSKWLWGLLRTSITYSRLALMSSRVSCFVELGR